MPGRSQQPSIQARHYYVAAATADKTVKPLLLYYGVVSLSRGLVLFVTRKLREAALAQSHGLSIRDWQTVLSAAAPDIGDLQISVNGAGSFVELLRATGNRSLLRANSSGVNHKAAQPAVPAKAVLTLGELLAGLPDVLDQLRRWKAPRCVAFSIDKIAGNNEANITVPRKYAYIDDRLVLGIIGRFHCDLVSIDAHNIAVRTKRGGTIGAMRTDFISRHFLGIGNLFLAQRYTCGAGLAKIAQLFAISYILSMLVRYHPAFWMDFVHQRIGDAALPTVFQVIDCIENLFPQIVVDFLEE